MLLHLQRWSSRCVIGWNRWEKWASSSQSHHRGCAWGVDLNSKYESGFSYFATSLWPLIWSLLLLLISEIFLDVLEVKYTQIIYFARYFSISCQEFIYNFTIKVLHGAEFLPYPDFMRYDDILTTTFLEAWFRARQNGKKKKLDNLKIALFNSWSWLHANYRFIICHWRWLRNCHSFQFMLTRFVHNVTFFSIS